MQIFTPSSTTHYSHQCPLVQYNTAELFAGAGGMALGFERAGFTPILLNEWDKDASKTLKNNRPDWNVLDGDISNVDFSSVRDTVDLVSGGFPCQAFSHAGKRLGLEDTRGTMFYEFARCVLELRPKMFVAENVKGLLQHDGGKTLEIIINCFEDLGYEIVFRCVLKAVEYMVPQRRERIFIIGIRSDLDPVFDMIPDLGVRYTVADALRAGVLYGDDVPVSSGANYSEKKRAVLDLVPPGGNWRHLPIDIQKDYMKASYHASGGRTGVARRLSWDKPCTTLTTWPAQKQTEKCHPSETRPLSVREYARIQTFPDDWSFDGSIASQYRQIGNAVPVNLSYFVGQSLIRKLNSLTVVSGQEPLVA